MASEEDRTIGLIPGGKYTVYKNVPGAAPGTMAEEPVLEAVFVLKFSDPIARVAIEAYADEATHHGYHQLARDLTALLDSTG